jgi:hypothetical protein
MQEKSSDDLQSAPDATQQHRPDPSRIDRRAPSCDAPIMRSTARTRRRATGMTAAQALMRTAASKLAADVTNNGRDIMEFAARVLAAKEPDCTDAKSRRWAAAFLADRLWGRPALTVEVASEQDGGGEDLRGKTMAELRRLAAEQPDGDSPGN